jgi:hypothetical protein
MSLFIMKGSMFMRFYYGEKNPLRVLDEIEFWKRQEAEHTIVIRQIVDNLESEFVSQLQQLERAFQQVEGMAVKYIETIIRSNDNISLTMQQQIMQLISLAFYQSQQFVMLLNRILSKSEAVHSNPVAVVVINHIRRESEYFIGIVQTVLS